MPSLAEEARILSAIKGSSLITIHPYQPKDLFMQAEKKMLQLSQTMRRTYKSFLSRLSILLFLCKNVTLRHRGSLWGLVMIGVVAVLLIFSCVSFAGDVEFGPTKTQIFRPKKCRSTDTCDLKEFRLDVTNYRAWMSDSEVPSMGVTAHKSYTVSKPRHYNKFAIVQYIKGCVFESKKNTPDTIGIDRNFFGKLAPFQHKDWEIDSRDTDPMYRNMPSEWINYNLKVKNRHSSYYWSDYGNLHVGSENLIAHGVPKNNFIFITDRPGTSFLSDGEARNTSLKLKTCIYKTKDVPLSVTRPDAFLKGAIACLDWEQSHIFNFETNRYESIDGIHPTCR